MASGEATLNKRVVLRWPATSLRSPVVADVVMSPAALLPMWIWYATVMAPNKPPVRTIGNSKRGSYSGTTVVLLAKPTAPLSSVIAGPCCSPPLTGVPLDTSLRAELLLATDVMFCVRQSAGASSVALSAVPFAGTAGSVASTGLAGGVIAIALIAMPSPRSMVGAASTRRSSFADSSVNACKFASPALVALGSGASGAAALSGIAGAETSVTFSCGCGSSATADAADQSPASSRPCPVDGRMTRVTARTRNRSSAPGTSTAGTLKCPTDV